jgi:quercetin dioxygenase-like cupin family protein
MASPIVNLADVQLRPRPEAHAPTGDAQARFEARTGRVGSLIGARTLGHNVTAVAPGKSACPLHSHRVNEEMFFVLQGQGEVRIGDQVHPVRTGDFIACPAGGIDPPSRCDDGYNIRLDVNADFSVDCLILDVMPVVIGAMMQSGRQPA